MTDQIAAIVEKYQELRSYCDTFFSRAALTAGSSIRCRSGCSDCCVLETVCELEAYVISQYLKNEPIDKDNGQDTKSNKAGIPEKNGACPFLNNSACTIYTVRPIICRTHGLPLLNRLENRIECCPHNFPGVDVSESFSGILFDSDAVTEALMRLNAALLISRGDDPRINKRVNLVSLKGSVR